MKPYIFIIFLLSGCSSVVKISGEYASSSSPHSFVLKNDSTFAYRYKFEFAYQHSEGVWRKQDKSNVILNSHFENRLLPLSVLEYNNNAKKEDAVNLLNVNTNIPDAERKYYQCSIYINDSFFAKRSCDSIGSVMVSQSISDVFFKLSADERMPVRFLDTLSTEKYFVRSPGYNKLNVEIIYNDSLFNYRIFKNETLKVSREGLRFYSFQDNDWQYLPRKKD